VQIAVYERGLAGDAAQPRLEPVKQAVQPRAARGRQRSSRAARSIWGRSSASR
jgi:hypothetical protein